MCSGPPAREIRGLVRVTDFGDLRVYFGTAWYQHPYGEQVAGEPIRHVAARMYVDYWRSLARTCGAVPTDDEQTSLGSFRGVGDAEMEQVGDTDA